MITITRLLAKQLRSLFKRALHTSAAKLPPIHVVSGAQGLTIRVAGRVLAAEYHRPGPLPAAELTIPFAVLDDVQGSQDEAVVIASPRADVLSAAWHERGAERRLEYAVPGSELLPFPEAPSTYSTHSPELVTALRDAFEITDPESSRYALGCVQLRGAAGDLASTDGRQMLLHTGFAWGFTENLLVPKTKLFECRELPSETDVQIGKTEKHLVVRIGSWTFWLGLGEGVFPKVEQVVPAKNGTTVVEWPAADREFLRSNVNRLPANPGEHKVTLELNGAVILRAKSETTQGTELVLANATKDGDDVRVSADRRFLVRAATMGFDRLYVRNESSALLAADERRSYVFMPLDKSEIMRAGEGFLRIESPLKCSSRFHTATRSSPPLARPLPSPVSQPISAVPPAVGQDRTSLGAAPVVVPGGSIEQAIALREQLRTLLDATKDLIRSLQAERKQARLLKSTLASLKQLQQVA